MPRDRTKTKTGGRQATLRHIPGDVALAVGMPPRPSPPKGWRWVALTDVAQMESGHTPSRRHAEYWEGDIPWIGIKDAKAHHGRVIHETREHTNQLGLENSSARLLPAGTVCLSRTASVGYVTVMGRPMATSQDFVNWLCGDDLLSEYLKYLFLVEERALLRFASGAVHQTIYYPEAKAMHICMPPLPEQKRIVAILDELFVAIATTIAHADRKLALLGQLKRSLLNTAFAGELATDSKVAQRVVAEGHQ